MPRPALSALSIPGTLDVSPTPQTEDGPEAVTERRRLLEPHELAEQGPAEAVRLPLDLIDPNPLNPRRALAEIPELAASIREFGLLQPVAVRRQGDRYELIAGHRRYAAFTALRDQEPTEVVWRTIPAVVRTESDDERAHLMLISAQVHNNNWTPKEEAGILEDLARSMSFPQIGALIHKQPNWVSHRLLVYGDSVLSAYVQSGRLPATVAEELRHIKDTDQRRAFAERAVAEEWKPERARIEVRRLRPDKQVAELGRRVQELLDLLATVQPSEIDVQTFRQLWTIHGCVEALAEQARAGTGPVFPSIAAAERKAGVRPGARPRKPAARRRVMPRPS